MGVSVIGGAGTQTALRIHRSDCSASRPQLCAYLPFRAVMERVSEGGTWTLAAISEESCVFNELFTGAGTGAVGGATAARGVRLG